MKKNLPSFIEVLTIIITFIGLFMIFKAFYQGLWQDALIRLLILIILIVLFLTLSSVVASIIAFIMFSVGFVTFSENEKARSKVTDAALEFISNVIIYEDCPRGDYVLREYIKEGIGACIRAGSFSQLDTALELANMVYVNGTISALEKTMTSPKRSVISTNHCIKAMQISLDVCPHYMRGVDEDTKEFIRAIK